MEIRDLDATVAPPPRQVLAITSRDRLSLPPIAQLLTLIPQHASHEPHLP